MDQNFNALPPKITFGLKNKFRLIITVFLLAIFGITAVILISSSNRNLTEQLTNEAKAYASLSYQPTVEAYKLYYDSGYLKFREVINNLLSLNANISYILIFDANGNLLVDSRSLSLEKPSIDNTQADQSVVGAVKKAKPVFMYKQNSNQINEIIYPYEDSWGNRSFAVKYFVSYEKVLNSASRVQNEILILAIFSLVFSLSLISFLVGKTILSPIEAVHKGAQMISRGKLDYEINVKTQDEVEDLAFSVNQMARTLQGNIESLRKVDKLKDEFIIIASHYLRTPLTAIRGYLSLIKDGRRGLLNPLQQKYVERISENIHNLANLVESLLSVASFEAGSKSFVFSQANILDIAKEVIESFQEEALRKNVSFYLEAQTVAVPQLSIDKAKISAVFKAIIDNAIKFSRNGGRIEVSFGMKDNDLIVHVKDYGSGIGRDELPYIFEKFHRGVNRFDFNYPGKGLDLYISKLIIAAHRGKIWAESEINKGTILSFSLPVSNMN